MGEKALPRHVAIIMDGNGRWAKKRLLPRAAGHRAGMNRMIGLSEHIFDRGIRYCTLFALSTENLSRPQSELEGLYALFREYFPRNTHTLREKGIVLRVIGDRTLLPADIVRLIAEGESLTAGSAERSSLRSATADGRTFLPPSMRRCGADAK